jgi:hypothetical protein
MEWKKLTLANIANGVAPELFERELSKVLENVADPNTKSDAVRSITLQVKILPDPNKEGAVISVFASSKLAPVKQAIGTTHFGKNGGKFEAYTQNINQLDLDLTDKLDKGPKIVGGLNA